MFNRQKHTPIKSRIDVTTESDGIIRCILHGHITEELVKKSMVDTAVTVKQIRDRQQIPQLLIDAKDVLSQTSGARTQAKALGQMGIEKIAVCGPNPALSFIVQYLIRSGGMAKYAKIFRTQAGALQWLKSGRMASSPQDKKGLRYIIGGFLILTSCVGFAGWLLDIEILRSGIQGLKPTNPVSLLTILLLGVGLLFVRKYGAGKGLARAIPIAVGIWALAFGSTVLLRALLNINLPTDAWLFTHMLEQDIAMNATSVRSGMLFFIAGMMMLTIMTGQRKYWQRKLLDYSSGIGFLLAIGAVINYGFGLTGVFAAPTSLRTAICFLLLNYAIMSASRKEPLSERISQAFNKYLPAIFVGLSMLIVTGVAWQQSNADFTRSVNEAIEQDFSSKEIAITDRLNGYINTLRGFRSFFEASDDVTPAEFRTYFQTSNVAENYPGLTAITFVYSVPASQRNSFNNHVRALTSPAFPNYKNFSIYPVTTLPVMYPTTLVEPSTPATSYGFDLNSNETRRQLLERARDTSDLAASDVIDLNAARNDPTLEKRPGFYLTLPVYQKNITTATVAERQTHIYGYVNALFESSKLFGEIFKEDTNDLEKFIISNARSGEVLYTHNGDAPDIESELKYTKNLTIGGQTWKLDMYTTPHFTISGFSEYLPPLILLTGSLFSALATLLMVMQSRRRDNAVRLAESMTEDLNNERSAAVANQQKDDAVLSSIGDAVFAIDVKGIITLFNPAAEKISGHTKEEAIGKHYKKTLNFILGKDGSSNDTFINHALAGQVSSMKDHTQLIRKDGSKVAVADSAAPIHDARGKMLGVIVVFRDITKDYELDRAKSEFVSLASHQLRTPLSAIGWYTEMLLNGDSGELNKEQKEQLNEIYQGNARMVELVNSLLNVSRLELGKLQNDALPTSITDIAHSLQLELAPTVTTKKMTLNMNVDNTLPKVVADPKLLRMILQNIMSNAVKYTPNNGTVTVMLQQAVAARDQLKNISLKHPLDAYLIFQVTDSGYGIPKAQQNKIFQKMFRADNVRALDVEGTGLGLYIVREVVHKLDGKIWFTSTEGKGTTFTVILPFITKSTLPKP